MVLKVLSLMPWLGGYPWLGSALFFLLGTPFWFQGIIPCLILKILLVKGALILGPPIALGAFVLGQGSGLLIGKLIGIKLVLKAVNYKHYPSGEFEYDDWKGLHDSIAWKAKRIRMKLQNLRVHPTYSPSPNYDFHSYPPIRNIKYTQKPYGTYKYEGWDNGNNQVVDTSDWLSGPGPDYGHTEATAQYLDRETNQYGSITDGFYSELPVHAHYNLTSSYTQDSPVYYSSYKKQLKNSNKGQLYEPLGSDVENFIRAEVHKLKSGQIGDVGAEAEAMEELINEQFAKDLLESIQENTVPVFVPFRQMADKTSSNVGNKTKGEGEESMATFVLSSLSSSIQDLNPLNFLPQSVLSWLSPAELKTSTEAPQETKRRHKREIRKINVDQMTRSVVNDIRNLFSIISFLDISRCLEKMVCEIHSRGQEFKPRHLAGSYEGHVIIAFRIMDSIMGNDEDKHVSKYRAAARLGQKYNRPELCLKKFSTCPISTSQLISLGKLTAHAH